MILCFELSLSHAGGDYFAINRTICGTASIARAQEILNKGLFSYRFENGLLAAVRVRRVGIDEAKKIRKQSKGFRGYDWMIDSIIDHMTITA